jgi:hypothetical protein
MKLPAFLAAFTLAAATLLPASPLSELVDQAGASWMLGPWASADGQVKLTYEWRLDQQAIAVKFTAGERCAEGMMALKPGTGEVHYVAVDNSGAVTTGRWIESNGNPTLQATKHADSGDLTILAEHRKVDEQTMKVTVYRQNDDGNPGEFLMEAELKRQ